jgi:hypothetical protein
MGHQLNLVFVAWCDLMDLAGKLASMDEDGDGDEEEEGDEAPKETYTVVGTLSKSGGQAPKWVAEIIDVSLCQHPNTKFTFSACELAGGYHCAKCLCCARFQMQLFFLPVLVSCNFANNHPLRLGVVAT